MSKKTRPTEKSGLLGWLDPSWRQARAEARPKPVPVPTAEAVPGTKLLGVGQTDWSLEALQDIPLPQKRLPAGERYVHSGRAWGSLTPRVHSVWLTARSRPATFHELNLALYQDHERSLSDRGALDFQKEYLAKGLFIPWPMDEEEAIRTLALKVSHVAKNPWPKMLDADDWRGLLTLERLHEAFAEHPPLRWRGKFLALTEHLLATHQAILVMKES
jgi:hypothetical protein